MATNVIPFERLGRYRILSKIDEGGMGAVYLAEDTHLDRRVALKVPHFGTEDSPAVIERFQREARLAGRINHPNMCAVYDVGEADGIHYFTMPFIEGVPLSKNIVPSAPWPEKRAAELVHKIALAVNELHALGIVHRDLKPSNIMLRGTGEPVLMDFGLARSFTSESDRLTRTGAPVGSPAYMSPEQVLGSRDIGPAADVYGLGVILYQMVTGHLPFSGPPVAVYGQVLHAPVPRPTSFRPDLDPAMETICLKALRKNASERCRTMAAFATELAAYVGNAAVPVPEAIPATITGAELWEPTSSPSVACPKCGKVLKVPATVSGRKVKCPRCDAVLGRVADTQDIPVLQQAEQKTTPQLTLETVPTPGPRNAPTRRPPAKKPGKKEPTGSAVSLWCGIIACILVGAAVGAYFLLRTGRDDPSSPANARDFDYVPRDGAAFVVLNVTETLSGSLGAAGLEKLRLDAEFRKVEAESGLKAEDLERATFVYESTKANWAILRTKRPYDEKKLLASLKTQTPRTHAGKIIHPGMSVKDPALHFADERTILISEVSGLERALDVSKASKSGPLQAAVDRALKERPLLLLAAAAKPNEARPLPPGNDVPKAARHIPIRKLPAQEAMPPEDGVGGLALDGQIPGARAVVFALTSKQKTTVDGWIDFLDSDRAESGKEKVRGMVASWKHLVELIGLQGNLGGLNNKLLGQLLTEFVDSVAIVRTDKRLTISTRVETADLLAFIRGIKVEEPRKDFPPVKDFAPKKEDAPAKDFPEKR